MHVRNEHGGVGFGGTNGVAEVLEHAGLIKVRNNSCTLKDSSTVVLTWGIPTAIGLGLYFQINRDRLKVGTDQTVLNNLGRYKLVESRIPTALSNMLSIH